MSCLSFSHWNVKLPYSVQEGIHYISIHSTLSALRANGCLFGFTERKMTTWLEMLIRACLIFNAQIINSNGAEVRSLRRLQVVRYVGLHWQGLDRICGAESDYFFAKREKTSKLHFVFLKTRLAPFLAMEVLWHDLSKLCECSYQCLFLFLVSNVSMIEVIVSLFSLFPNFFL